MGGRAVVIWMVFLFHRYLRNSIRFPVGRFTNFVHLRSGMNNLVCRRTQQIQHFSFFPVRAKTQKMATPFHIRFCITIARFNLAAILLP
jgi:hypothetical protein